MPSLDPQVVMHRLNIKQVAKLVKQQQRRFWPDIMEAIEAEFQKLIECGYIWEEQHPDWVANIVPVLKKNRKVWIFIDFRDLNIAYPKDEFLLPITDVMIDNTCGFERMSFMDGFSGYNQIKMYIDDKKHTSFQTLLGVFCYTVIYLDWRLRAPPTTCNGCNLSRSPTKNSGVHLHDLRMMFDLMRAHGLKMNPTKSFLGV